MNNLTQQQLHACGNCHRELPLSDYYITRGKRDNYCKHCRREAARDNYLEARRRSLIRKPYIVITEVDDPEVRLLLIKKALQTVRQSIERKRQRERELEYEAEE